MRYLDAGWPQSLGESEHFFHAVEILAVDNQIDREGDIAIADQRGGLEFLCQRINPRDACRGLILRVLQAELDVVHTCAYQRCETFRIQSYAGGDQVYI